MELQIPEIFLPISGLSSKQVLFEPVGVSGFDLVYIDNEADCRAGPIHDNSDADVWIPDPVDNTLFAGSILPFSELGSWDKVGASGNTLHLRPSGAFLTPWYSGEGGWFAYIGFGGSYEAYAEDMNIMDPCSDWTIEAWGVGLNSAFNPVGNSGAVEAVDLRLWLEFGNVEVYLTVEQREFSGPPYGPAQYNWAGCGFNMCFPCGSQYFGMTTADKEDRTPRSSLGAVITYEAATKTVSWAFGTESGGLFNSSNAVGSYQDKWGFGGVCPNSRIGGQGGPGIVSPELLGIRKISVTHEHTPNPSGVIMAGP